MAPNQSSSQNNGILLQQLHFHKQHNNNLIIKFSFGRVLFLLLLLLQFIIIQQSNCIPNINNYHFPQPQRSSRNSNSNTNNRLGLPQRSEQFKNQFINLRQEGRSRNAPLGNRWFLDCGIQPLDDFNLIDSYWTVNGSQITIDNEHFQVSDLDLTIDSVRQEDHGTYRCVLKFSQGILLGPPYALNIIAFHVQHESTNTQFEYYLGQNVIIKCPVYSVPPGVVTWKSLSTATEGSLPRFIVLNSGELVIRNLRSEDSGSYECSVKNKMFPEPLSSSVHLSVLPGPDLTPVSLLPTFPNIARLKEEPISYYCLTNKASVPAGWESLLNIPDEQGNPSHPEYFGEVIRLSRINGTSESTCSAPTSSGHIFKQLISSLPPNFPNLPIMNHPPAKTVRFECKSSEPVRWFKDGEELIPNTGRIKQHKPYELLISNTIQSDSGIFQCESGSRIGTGILIVEPINDQPNPPINLRCFNITSKTILVQWDNDNLNSQSSFTLLAYTVHYTPAAGTEKTRVTNDSKVLVENLLPNTNYSIYVTSYTNIGASVPSLKIHCSTLEDYPLTTPEILLNSQRKVGPTQVSLIWIPLSPIQARGLVKEYKLQWRKERSSTFSHIIYLYGDVTETVITGLEPCTSYSFRLSPATNLGFSPLEDSFQWTNLETSCTNITFAPSLIPELHMLNSSSSRIEWNGPSTNRTIQGYKIYLAHEGSSGVYYWMPPIVLYDPEITSYTFTNLVPLTRYLLRISYFGEDFESDLSSKLVIETSEATTAHEVLLPVTEIQATASPSTVNLNWTAPSPRIFPEFYLVKYNLVGSENFFIDRCEDLHYSVDQLVPGRYEFSIGYKFKGREGPFSEKVEIKTLEGAPGPPTLLAYQVLSNTSVRISWNSPILSNGPIKSYKVSLSNDSQFSTFLGFLTNETSIILPLHPGQKAWVRVTAETEAGVGPYSDAIPIEIFRPNISSTTTPGTSISSATDSLADLDQKQRINTTGIIIGIILALFFVVTCVIILACHNRVFTYIITHCRRRRTRRDVRGQGTGKDTVDSGPGMVEMKILSSQEILDTKGGHPNGTVVSLSNCEGLSVNDPLLLRRPDVSDPIE